MKTIRLSAITALTAFVFSGVGCAPTDLPGPDEGKAPAPEAAPATALLSAPAPGAAVPLPATRPPSGADGLKARIDAAIDQVRRRDLLTTNGFWTVFHGILGLGPSVELLDPLTGKRVNALDYIASGGEVRGVRFIPTPDGVDVGTLAGSFVGQGHQDQFVAEMTEWYVPPDKMFKVDGVDHPFSDFTRYSKARVSVKENQELDYAVLIIGQQLIGPDYKPDDVKKEWVNTAGERLCYEDVLRKALDQPLSASSCGGTHRLFGLTWAYHLHLLHGGRTEGVWKDLADKMAHYKDVANRLQNKADGSFSTSFFDGPGNATDIQLRINTTGHTLEWLALEETDEELQAPWMCDAANALSLMILDNEGTPLEGGTLYHAVHGLLMYRARVFGAADLGPLAPHPPLLPKEGAKLS